MNEENKYIRMAHEMLASADSARDQMEPNTASIFSHFVARMTQDSIALQVIFDHPDMLEAWRKVSVGGPWSRPTPWQFLETYTPSSPAEVSDKRQDRKVADEEKTYILESTRLSDENKATSEYLRDMIGS